MRHLFATTSLILGLTFGIATTTQAQTDTTKRAEKITKLVTVTEDNNHTRVTFPGGKVEVQEMSDTITKITIGRRRFEIIDKPGFQTRIQMVRVPRKHFKGHWSGFDIGFTNFFSAPFNSDLAPEDNWMDLNSGKSISLGFNLLQYNIELQNNRNQLGLVTGLGWQINNYRLDSPNLIHPDAEGRTYYEKVDRNIKKNKLVTSFLTVPLLLEIQIPGQDNQSKFFLSAGPYGSFRLGSHTKVIYDDSDGKEKEKWREDLNLNAFKYGMMVRTGYKWLKLYASCDLSRMFESNRGPKIYPWTIGFTLVQF